MDKYHYNSRIPHKNSKYHKLTKEEIKENKDLAKDRILLNIQLHGLKGLKCYLQNLEIIYLILPKLLYF